MKGLFGVDVYRLFGTTWILTNIAFGVVVIVAGIWALKKFGHRMNQRFLRDLAGYNLNAAAAFLTKLAEFENYSPQERSSMREYSPDE
jgi:hypothetical protein